MGFLTFLVESPTRNVWIEESDKNKKTENHGETSGGFIIDVNRCKWNFQETIYCISR